jgi:hypothetical protein
MCGLSFKHRVSNDFYATLYTVIKLFNVTEFYCCRIRKIIFCFANHHTDVIFLKFTLKPTNAQYYKQINVKFFLEQVMKAQKGSRSIDLLFL